MNASFWVVEIDFLVSTNHKLILPSSGDIFFNESFIPAKREQSSLYWKLSTWEFFSTSQNCHWYEWKHFLKTYLILASGNSFSSYWKPFSFIASDIFQGILHPGLWKHIFQSRSKSIVFYLELFPLLVETIIEIIEKPIWNLYHSYWQ